MAEIYLLYYKMAGLKHMYDNNKAFYPKQVSITDLHTVLSSAKSLGLSTGTMQKLSQR